MKKPVILVLSFTLFVLIFCISCFEEYEEKAKLYDIEIQPEVSFGKDALIMYHPTNESIKNSNQGDSPSLLASAWEINDTLLVTRSLMEFNISGIKTDAEIIDAKLTLYFNPTDEYYSGHSTTSGSNAFWIERIIKYWTEDSVSWNSKPETTSVNAVLVESSTEPNQNYLDIDVTYLIRDIVINPVESYGFEIRLQTEQFYRAVVLASSDHIKMELHPKLRVVFRQ